VKLLFLAANCIYRAHVFAYATAGAFFFIDGISYEGLAYPCRASFFFNVGLILIPEISYRTEYRIGCSLTKGAERAFSNYPA